MQWSWLLSCRNAKWRQQNIKMLLRRKVIKSSSYYLCWLRVFAWKNALMSKYLEKNLEKCYTEKKKLSIDLLVAHCLEIVHLMQQTWLLQGERLYGKVLQRFKRACIENN